MACLLAAALAVAALMVVQPGQLMTAFAARTSPAAEAFWRAAMPGAPMPDAILELLHHEHDVPSGGGKANDAGDDPPPVPPMNFNYDDYRALPRSEAAAAVAGVQSPEVLNRVAVRNAVAIDDNGGSSPPATVFFLEDAVRVGESLPLPRAADTTAGAAALPLRLYTVRSVRAVEGSSFVVCRGEAAAAGAGQSSGGAVYGCRTAITTGSPARAYAVDVAGSEVGDAVTAAAVVCHSDTSRWDPDHAAFRLLGVRPGAAAVCRAVADARILSAKNGKD
ncbi:hypothetical protein E2562_024929 [Oryza meyeriana var. granulata]|uniref:BURP domain-containing protein n=1 Tax=Oryza meyeriana var. granulata TaxID=110450 RepID=A0A6G1DP28_9ORYZ|nr:hypothetical protein E2562_024929 [Oryza meyeriana var. granulata]